MNLENLKSALDGQPSYRFTQTYQFIFKSFISNWDEALSLPKDLREKLKIECPIEVKSEIFVSEEGKSQKALITLADGNKIESVLMRHSDIHNTVCVSCQVGCPMKCDFCATGKMGLKRNLSVDEILEQVLVFARILKKDEQRVSHVVFMGMGEPFLNYDNVINAIYKLNDKDCFNIAARKISISTCGIIPGIEKLAKERLQINLAISLHAPNDNLRSKLMPVNSKFNIDQTLSAVGRYIAKTNRKVMIEYVLLSGVNDSIANARELAKLLKEYLGSLFMVNLISYNFTTGKYRAPITKDRMDFKAALEAQGITVTQRFRLGRDIEGACGQLATKSR